MTQLDLLTGDGSSPFDAIRRADENGEHWQARDLMPLLGYSRWDRVPDVVDRASTAARNSGHNPDEHFRASSDVADHGYARADYRLTRYGAYLVAMNGDPRKAEIAAAQTYFAVQTRLAEVSASAALDLTNLDDIERVAKAASQAVAIAKAQQARAEIAENRVAELEPKAAQADHYRAANGLTAIGDFANDLAVWAKDTHKVKILHEEIRDFMAELGLLIRGNTIRHNEPTADAQKRGLMRIKHSTYETNTRGTQSSGSARLTQKGCGYVWDRATARIAEHGSLAPITSIERKVA